MTRAVFIDRDNTIIHNDGDLGDPDQVKLIQGAASAIASLRGLGFQIIIVTNQGGVARGKYEEADVDRVHERVAELIKETSGAIIECFYYCPYHPEATVEKYKQDHPWRKPKPGMLLQAAEDLGLNLESCWMVGDQLRDIEAGWNAGTRSVLLQPEGKEPENYAAPEGKRLLVASNLVDAVRLIAQHPQAERGEDLQQQNIIRAMKGASEEFGAELPDEGGTLPSGGTVAGGGGGMGISKLSPAIEKIHDGPTTSTVPKGPPKSQRPFKPWEIQPVIVTPTPAPEEKDLPPEVKDPTPEVKVEIPEVKAETPVAEVKAEEVVGAEVETPAVEVEVAEAEAGLDEGLISVQESPAETEKPVTVASSESPDQPLMAVVDASVEPLTKPRKKKKIRKKSAAAKTAGAQIGRAHV